MTRDIPYLCVALAGFLMAILASGTLAHAEVSPETQFLEEEETITETWRENGSTSPGVGSPVLTSPLFDLRVRNTRDIFRDVIRTDIAPEPAVRTWWTPTRMSFIDPVMASGWQRPF